MKIKKYNLNLISVTALGIGSVVGAGIFALLGQVITMAGSRTYLSFIIAGIAALFSGYSYSRLAAAYPDSGGLTDYFKIAFKKKSISGTFSLIYWITSMISICMMAKSFGIYIAKLFPEYADQLMISNTAAGAIIVLLALLNMMKSSDVGNAEILMVGIKMSILSALIIFALAQYDHDQTLIKTTPDNLQFWGSIGISFFAYAGYGIITNAAADVEHPAKTISRAIYLTILIVIGLYVSLAFVILNFIPPESLVKNADTAVAIAADKLMGGWGYFLIYLTAIIAFISGIGATYFSTFRIAYSLSGQKILPQIYHHVFWERGTIGNFLSVTLVLLSTICFDFNSIVNVSSGAYLVSYLAVFAANWKLRRETKSSALLIFLGTALMLFILIMFIYNLA